MKQGQYWGSTNIKCHGTKFSRLSHLASGIVHPCGEQFNKSNKNRIPLAVNWSCK